MLVLSRREGETIRISDDINLVVVKIKGGQVRIGIEAPKEITVRRGELGTRPQEEVVCAE